MVAVIKFVQDLQKLLPKSSFERLMKLFLRKCFDDASMQTIEVILSPYPQHLEDFMQFYEDERIKEYGKSYSPVEGGCKDGKADELNSTVMLCKQRVCAPARHFTVHEMAMHDCEDEQSRVDVAIGLMDWSIEQVAKLVKLKERVSCEKEFRLLVGRMETALGWTKRSVLEMLRRTEASDVLELLRKKKEQMVQNRQKSNTAWAKVYQEHSGFGKDQKRSGLGKEVCDNLLVAEIKKSWVKNSCSYSHRAFLPDLPADMEMEVKGEVSRDVNALVEGSLDKPSEVWSYIFDTILSTAPPVPSNSASAPEDLPLFYANNTTRNGRSRVFYATEHIYVSIRLYAKLHERVAQAQKTCFKLGRLSEYNGFLTAIAMNCGSKKRAELREDWNTTLRDEADNIHELLCRLQRHILHLDNDSKALIAIELHKVETKRSGNGYSHDYYSNAKYSAFPEDSVYQIIADSSTAIKVNFFPNEGSRTMDLNIVGSLVGCYASEDWVEQQLVDVENEDLQRGRLVFLRRNRQRSGKMAERETYLRNECLYRKTDRGHAFVSETDDVFVRFGQRPKTTAKRKRLIEDTIAKKQRCS